MSKEFPTPDEQFPDRNAAAICFQSQTTGERNEELHFTLRLDKALAEKYKAEVAVFTKPPAFVEDDELVVNYTLHISYHGVLKGLAAIETLLREPGVVKFANIEEVKHGRSLAYEVFAKLDRIARAGSCSSVS